MAKTVSHRRVLYIPGFDPFPVRRYREIYRREGLRQAAISGYDLALVKGPRGDRFGWRVAAQIDGAHTSTDIEVLAWSDIVKRSMGGSTFDTYLQLVQLVRTYVGSGALFRLMRLRKGPVIAALYPVAALLLYLVVALVMSWWAGELLARIHPWLWPVGLLAFPAVMRLSRRIDNRVLAYYLIHGYAFSARYGGAYPPELEARMRAFRSRVVEALNSETDEVLVVGHSVGAYIGVSVLADMIREGEVPEGGPALGFLSLGQVIPMVSFLPQADRLRADLALLSAREEVTWVDVTAPGDGCAFALCDPVAVTGVAPMGKLWPLVLSAAFSKTLAPETWAKMKRQFYALHFQYLHAFDRPGDYDYFRITAGPRTLAERYGGRSPSASRIETPVSAYTSQAA